jgi:hypothetical protein
MWSALATVGLAVASVVISESWFWGRWRLDDSVPEFLSTVAFYAAAVQVVRLVIARTGVRFAGAGSWRRVFLVGALYGWLVEGVIVTTVVDDLPLSLSYTGLAWHALFTVLLGWWGMPYLLARPLGRSVAGLVAVGAGVGAWAAFWRFEEGAQTPVLEYAVFAVLTTVAYAGGLALWWAVRDRATPTIRGSAVAIVVLAALAIVHAIENPLTLVGPAVVGLALFAILTTRPRPPLAEPPAAPTPYRALPRLLVIPAIATGIFAAFASTPMAVPTGWVFFAVTVPLGVVLLVVAWWRERSAQRRGQASNVVEDPPVERP